MIRSIACSSLVCLVLLSACGSPGETEYVARDADLQNPTAWTVLVEGRTGPGPDGALLGQAHEALDMNVSRSVYINKNVERGQDGTFPLGTILVKLLRKDSQLLGGTAMAKRGGGFNPDGGGWEWFVLKADGSIRVRGGAEVMDGLCNRCHGSRKNRDFVFVK